MNCFYHREAVAIGTCKSCGKGLCFACAVELNKGLACKERCEKDAQAVIDLIENNVNRAALYREIADSAKRNRYLGASFYLLFSLLIFGFAAYRYSLGSLQSPDYLFIGMGILFFGFGLVALRNAVRLS
jgi:hypothetical protein